MTEGTVVVCPSGQIGTVVTYTSDQAQVLLRNGEIWTGTAKQLREPQPGEVEHAPVNVDRKEPSPKKANRQKFD